MPSSADLPHRSQLLSPLNHRRLEYAMSLAVSQSAATGIWVGCDDADGDGKWENRYNFFFIVFYSQYLPIAVTGSLKNLRIAFLNALRLN